MGRGGSSFVAFAIGAVIPLMPFLLTTGTPAFVAALVLSFSGALRWSARRQPLHRPRPDVQRHAPGAIGAAAAAVTYAVGTLIGANVA